MKKLSGKIGAFNFFLVFFVVVMVLVLLLAYSAFRESEQVLIDTAEISAQKNVEMLGSTLTQKASQIESSFTLLQFSNTFSKVMSASSYSELSSEDISEFLAVISGGQGFLAEDNVSITTDLIHFSRVFSSDTLEMFTNDSFPQGKNPVVLGLFPDRTFSKVPYLTYGYHYSVSRQPVGNVFISTSMNEIFSDLSIAKQDGIYYLLSDEKGSYAFLLDNTVDSEEADRILASVNQLNQSDQKHTWVKQRPYIIMSVPATGTGCTITCVLVPRLITKHLLKTFFRSSPVLILLLISLVLGVLILNRIVIRPLNTFSRHIVNLRENPESYRDASRLSDFDGCRELQNIAQQFNGMMDSIRGLTDQIILNQEEIHRIDLMRKDLEINMLHSQINPHFLYNTLEMIRADAIDGKIDQICAISSAIGRFYRYSIKGASMVTFEEELEQVQAYLSIQEKRFAGKITAIYNISSEANEIKVPKMILQPLVENAVVHGLAPVKSGIIYVSAFVRDAYLEFSVRDDGCGISPQRLEMLQHQLQQDDYSLQENHVGLFNVYKRLTLLCGDRFSFFITSHPGEGTHITVSLPI